ALREKTDLEMSAEQRRHVDLAIADLLRRSGRTEEAISECGRIEREGGALDGRLYAVRGLAHASRGEKDLALADLDQAVARSPQEASFKDFLDRVRQGETFASTYR